MKKFKKIIPFTFIFILLLGFFNISGVFGYSYTDNNAYNFYQWANSGGRTNVAAYYVPETNEIKFVTSGTSNPTAVNRYSSIGYQARIALEDGTVLWTVFPQGSKGFNLKHETTQSGTIYSLYSLNYSSMLNTIKSEFLNTGKITQSQFDSISLGNVRFDAVYTVIISGDTKGVLNSNGTISSSKPRVYFTVGRYNATPTYYDSSAIRFNSSVPRATAYDNQINSTTKYSGILGSVTPRWSDSTMEAIPKRHNLKVTVAPNDSGSPTLSYSPNSHSWTNQNIQVTINASDDLKVDVVNYKYYKEGQSGSATLRTGNNGTKVNLSSEGKWQITGTAYDLSGHSTSRTSGWYYIDKTLPSGTFNPNSSNWRNSNLNVTFTPTDSGGSGVNYWLYRVYSNGAWSSWSGANYGSSAITLSAEGYNEIQTCVVDNAGNVSYPSSGGYYLDKTNPTRHSSTLTGHTYQDGNTYWVNYNTTLKYRNRGYDANSKIAKSYARVSASGVDVRSMHDWNIGGTHIDQYYTTGSEQISIPKVREYYVSSADGGAYRETEWDIVTKSVENVFSLSDYYSDNAGNNLGGGYYQYPNLTIGVDGTAPTGYYSPNGSDWRNSDMPLKLHISDSRSGLKDYAYRIESNGVWSEWKYWYTATAMVDFNLTGSGKFRIETEVRDNVGNSSKILSGYYYIDRTAPSGIFTPNSADWVNGSVSTIFDPSDTGGSGVKNWRYAISTDGGATYGSWSNYIIGDTTSLITMSSHGINRVKVEVVDNAGNTSTLTSGDYLIDKILPSGIFTPNSADWTNDSVSTSFNPSDTGSSGVKNWRYAISTDGGATYGSWSDYIIGDTTSNITLSAQGQNKVKAEVMDNAGNIGLVVSDYYNIDKTGAILSDASLTNERYRNDNDYWIRPNDNVFYTMIGTDTLSGIRYIYGRLNHTGLQSIKDELKVYYDFIGDKYSVSDVSKYVEVLGADNLYSSPDTKKVTYNLKATADNTDFDLHYSLTDIAGNTVGYNDTGMNLRTDGTAPTVSFSPNGRTHTHNYDVNINISDTRSGVKSVKYQVTNTNTKPTTWTTASAAFSVPITSEGTYYIHVETEDNVGNVRYSVSNAFVLDNEAPNLVMSHSPNPTMVFMDTRVDIRVDDPEDDLMDLELSLIDAEGLEIPIDNYVDLETDDIVGFNFIPEYAGLYKVKAVLSDLYPTNTRTFYYDVSVLDATINGEVHHTQKWDENRQKYNIAKTGNPESPRPYDLFFAGEKFMLKADVLTSLYVESVEVKILNTSIDSAFLEQKEGDIWEGEIWDESMMTWTDKILNFEFTATYVHGYQVKDTVTVNTDDENYFRLRQGF